MQNFRSEIENYEAMSMATLEGHAKSPRQTKPVEVRGGGRGKSTLGGTHCSDKLARCSRPTSPRAKQFPRQRLPHRRIGQTVADGTQLFPPQSIRLQTSYA